MAQSVYFIFGDEYLATAKAREIVAQLVPDPADPLALETIDAQAEGVDESMVAVGRCLEALGTVGFFGGRKVVWFRGVAFMGDSPAGRSERVKTALGRLGEVLKAGLPDGVVLVLSAMKVDKRLGFFKLLQGLSQVHEFSTPEKFGQARHHAAAVLETALDQAKIRMAGDAKEAFLDRVGADTRTILNETSKLATYLGASRTAVVADVEAVVSTSADAAAWDVQDAMGLRDVGRAVSTTRRLLFQRESPIALITLLQSRIRELLVYRESMDRGWLRGGGGRKPSWSVLAPEVDLLLGEGLGRDFRNMHPFRLQKLLEQAERYTVRELRRAQALAISAHRQLVTTGLPAQLVLETFLLQILPVPRRG